MVQFNDLVCVCSANRQTMNAEDVFEALGDIDFPNFTWVCIRVYGIYWTLDTI